MSVDFDEDHAYELLDSAYDAMKELDEREGLSNTWPYGDAGFEDDRDILHVSIGHVDENEVFRNLTVDYNPETEKLNVGYKVWNDYEIPDDEDLRIETGETIYDEPFAEVEEPEDVPEAVEAAYEESMEIDEEELREEGEQTRVNSLYFKEA
jgi:hypothetical protein